MNTNSKNVWEKLAGKEITGDEAFASIKKMYEQTGGVKKEAEQIYKKTYVHNDNILKDHKLFQTQVLMGVTHASLALNALKQRFPDRTLPSLNKITFYNAIRFKDADRVDVITNIDGDGDVVEFKNIYRNEAGSEQITAQGEAHYSNDESGSHAVSINREELIKSATREEDGAVFYNAKTEYGPSLFTIKKVYHLSDGILGYLHITPEMSQELSEYVIHPAIFDAGYVNSMFAAGLDIVKNDIWVPLFIKSIKAHGNIPVSCNCYTHLIKKTDELIITDSDYYDEGGKLVLTIEGMNIKRVPSAESLLGDDGRAASHEYEENAQTGEKKAGIDNVSMTEIIDNAKYASDENIKSNIEHYIIKAIRRLLNDGNAVIDVKKNFMDLGIDSSRLIEISQTIEKDIGIELYPTLFFEYQNIAELTDYFIKEHYRAFAGYFNVGGHDNEDVDREPHGEQENRKHSIHIVDNVNASQRLEGDLTGDRLSRDSHDIAVIGMAGRLAGSSNLDEFWRHIGAGEDMIREIPADRWSWREWYDDNRDAPNKTYSKWGSFIDDADKFDSGFFGVSPREAVWLDPQLRILHEVIYETMEDAGYASRIAGTNTGVYVGVCFQEYWDEIVRAHIPLSDFQHESSAMSSISGNISYRFDLQGASIPLDNACASSLTALHLACNALRKNENDLAFVAGTNLLLSPLHYVYFSRIQALSPTGHCHTFDERADGYVPGEGVVALLLKPLTKAIQHRDNIHAIIKGTAINHVGRSNNPTSPRPELQTKLLIDAWTDAGISPELLTYIECHGTGTKIGDPIEITALKKAFNKFTNKEAFCAIGSTKAHIGHLEGAAGVASIVKVILQMQHKTIPSMPDFRELNSYIKLDGSPLYINRESKQWVPVNGIKLCAGISSFGMTGNNAHVVLEEYIPKITEREIIELTAERPNVFILSAVNKERLNDYVSKILSFLKRYTEENNFEGLAAEHSRAKPALGDVAYTLQTCRDAMDERMATVVSSIDELIERLQQFAKGSFDSEQIYQGNIKKNAESLCGDEEINAALGEGDLAKVARQWVCGANIDWKSLYPDQQNGPCQTSLPTYPFKKLSYWFERTEIDKQKSDISASAPISSPQQLIQLRTREDTVKSSMRGLDNNRTVSADAEIDKEIRVAIRSELASVLFISAEEIDEDEPFAEYGMDSILVVEFINRLNSKFGTQIQANKVYDLFNVKKIAGHISSIIGKSNEDIGAAGIVSSESSIASHEIAVDRTPSESVRVQLKMPSISTQTKTGVREKVDIDHVKINKGVSDAIKSELASVLFISADEIDEDEPFAEYGMDSVLGVEFINKLNSRFGTDMQANKLYDCFNAKKIAKYITSMTASGAEHINKDAGRIMKETTASAVKSKLVLKESSQIIPPLHVTAKDTRIAIIGMSARYPEAGNADLFWENLKNGRNCIKEIPTERWDWKKYYNSDPEVNDKTISRWGGFIDDIDKFDPLFFNISPSDAEIMDPQQRIFLEEAYKALEDAGYPKLKLDNIKCGIYVGIANFNEYSHLLQSHPSVGNSAQALLGSADSILASRIAYFLNLKGPAIPIDTACSSSLVAIHLACKCLMENEAEMMIAGGVSALITQGPYIMMSKAGMLSPDGKCKAFDNGANGFVPGEGVGCVVLKTLTKAINDGDHIYGVIVGSGINQDGKTNGITAPCGDAQRDLELEVYERYGVNPELINYVEAHGTGTKLGDPIEVSSLNESFRKYTDKKQYCAIGSVKTNIGHTTSAAGVASVIKVLLSLKHKQIPPTINYAEPNEHINFNDSPFYVNIQLHDWEKINGYPRCAVISSFGFSGTNAHLVISEYASADIEPQKNVNSQNSPQLVVLSAKDKDRLREYTINLLNFLSGPNRDHIDLASIAYTSQTAREAMNERLTVAADNIDELIEKLGKHIEGQCSIQGLYTGNIKALKDKKTSVDGQSENEEYIHELFAKGMLNDVAALWVNGRNVDWESLYDESTRPQKISMPTYPFRRQRCWIPTTSTDTASEHSLNKIHELLDSNESTLEEQRYRKMLTGIEYYLRDHVVSGAKVLPGVAYLEMARVAGDLAGAGSKVKRISDVVWQQPVVVEGGMIEVYVSLFPGDNHVDYEITSTADNGEGKVVNAQGKITYGEENEIVAGEQIDLEAIRSRCVKVVDKQTCYRTFHDRGLAYGPCFQGIRELLHSDNEALAEIELPEELKDKFGDYVLHPALMDAALQGVIGVMGGAGEGTYIPFSIGAVDIVRPMAPKCYSYVRCVDGGKERMKRFNITIVNERGEILVQIKDFVVRKLTVHKSEPYDDANLRNILEKLKAGKIQIEEAGTLLGV